MNNNIGECNPGLECNNGNDVTCCKSKVICKKPQCLSDITTECIFVEKVFDARITKSSLEFAFFPENPLIIDIEPTDLVSIETINAECNLLSLETSIASVKINDEFFDVSTTVSGPGGDQVVLNRQQLKKILNPNCSKEDKGTKVQMAVLVRLLTTFEIVVTGTGIDSNGLLVPYTGSIQIPDILFGTTLTFKDFCIPPLSLFPISLFTSCLMSCNFVLTGFEFSQTSDEVALDGGLILCVTCETLLKVPSQICALTTGPCKIKKSKGFCDDDDFPDGNLPSSNDKLEGCNGPCKNNTSSIKKTEGTNKKNMTIKTNEHQLSPFFGQTTR